MSPYLRDLIKREVFYARRLAAAQARADAISQLEVRWASYDAPTDSDGQAERDTLSYQLYAEWRVVARECVKLAGKLDRLKPRVDRAFDAEWRRAFA